MGQFQWFCTLVTLLFLLFAVSINGIPRPDSSSNPTELTGNDFGSNDFSVVLLKSIQDKLLQAGVFDLLNSELNPLQAIARSFMETGQDGRQILSSMGNVLGMAYANKDMISMGFKILTYVLPLLFHFLPMMG
ncbi:unnamed protein product [Allacma fusca]|uniref:Uncharacterized protein n=1 Tax=Allacma fusca TaxID=39272 RepID=A0A8J2K2E7_9HEXA|nr:unnamed protein product [Allacma fusca]